MSPLIVINDSKTPCAMMSYGDWVAEDEYVNFSSKSAKITKNKIDLSKEELQCSSMLEKNFRTAKSLEMAEDALLLKENNFYYIVNLEKAHVSLCREHFFQLCRAYEGVIQHKMSIYLPGIVLDIKKDASVFHAMIATNLGFKELEVWNYKNHTCQLKDLNLKSICKHDFCNTDNLAYVVIITVSFAKGDIVGFHYTKFENCWWPYQEKYHDRNSIAKDLWSFNQSFIAVLITSRQEVKLFVKNHPRFPPIVVCNKRYEKIAFLGSRLLGLIGDELHFVNDENVVPFSERSHRLRLVRSIVERI